MNSNTEFVVVGLFVDLLVVNKHRLIEQRFLRHLLIIRKHSLDVSKERKQ